MKLSIYKTNQVNSINTITCEIEETFMNNFSILIYDNEGGLFVERFADTYEAAKIKADKLFNKYCNQY